MSVPIDSNQDQDSDEPLSDSLFSGGDPAPNNQQPDSTELGGQFRIIRELARGGLGVIYLAEDLELQRQVALKQIRTERADERVYQ
ncbi:MAG: hypothetical protein AAGJ40_24570, partial [Planctomycetota bacterium]